jgi:hypothetical protein
MVVIGLAFIIFAALIQFTGLSIVASAFLVGIGLVVLALLLGERSLR